jgi:hypothetical protein
MTQEQIRKTIEDYNQLERHVKDTVEKMGDLDKKYWLYRGIVKITFYEKEEYKDIVDITYDDTCFGCYGEGSFSFPIGYLSMTDEELNIAIASAKRIEYEKEKQFLEDKKKRESELKELNDRLEYERLKDKFENK